MRAEGSSAIGDGRQVAIALTPDVDGTGSGSLLDSILSTLFRKRTPWSNTCITQIHLLPSPPPGFCLVSFPGETYKNISEPGLQLT